MVKHCQQIKKANFLISTLVCAMNVYYVKKSHEVNICHEKILEVLVANCSEWVCVFGVIRPRRSAQHKCIINKIQTGTQTRLSRSFLMPTALLLPAGCHALPF